MNNITGSPVQGDDFYGREHELEKILRSARLFKDILLLSPRRVGKSSISLEASNRLHDEGWLTILCDAQAAKTEADLLDCFRTEFAKVKKVPKNLLTRMDEFARNFRKLFRGVKVSAAGGALEVTNDEIIDTWNGGSKAVEEILVHLSERDEQVFLVLG